MDRSCSGLQSRSFNTLEGYEPWARAMIDGLEIVAIDWLSREQPLALELPGHLRHYFDPG
jgi:hypothetical protein